MLYGIDDVSNVSCGRGEIGKHKRLKISRPHGLAGSSPAARTNMLVESDFLSVIVLKTLHKSHSSFVTNFCVSEFFVSILFVNTKDHKYSCQIPKYLFLNISTMHCCTGEVYV